MIKANATTEEPKAIKLEFSVSELEAAKLNLKFPIDNNRRNLLDELRNHENAVTMYSNNIEEYSQYVEDSKTNLHASEARIVEIKDTLPPELSATPDEMKAELESVAKLAWVESVKLNKNWVTVTTKRGVLKTVFERRNVVFQGQGYHGEEFIDPPIEAELPQYIMRVNITRLGQRFSNDRNSLGIQLADLSETKKFVANNIVNHQAHPHWASNGNLEPGSWNVLCLGEYDNDATAASIKGLAPLFVELSVYLQNSGDEGNAYRTKRHWAAGLGKEEYNSFITRFSTPEETPQSVNDKFREDYRKHKQPEEGSAKLVSNNTHSGRRRAQREARRMDTVREMVEMDWRTMRNDTLEFHNGAVVTTGGAGGLVGVVGNAFNGIDTLPTAQPGNFAYTVTDEVIRAADATLNDAVMDRLRNALANGIHTEETGEMPH